MNHRDHPGTPFLLESVQRLGACRLRPVGTPEQLENEREQEKPEYSPAHVYEIPKPLERNSLRLLGHDERSAHDRIFNAKTDPMISKFAIRISNLRRRDGAQQT
jgi:hypothetical protein